MNTNTETYLTRGLPGPPAGQLLNMEIVKYDVTILILSQARYS